MSVQLTISAHAIINFHGYFVNNVYDLLLQRSADPSKADEISSYANTLQVIQSTTVAVMMKHKVCVLSPRVSE